MNQVEVLLSRPIAFVERQPSRADCDPSGRIWAGHWNRSISHNRWIWTLINLDKLKMWKSSMLVTHFIPGFASVLPTTLFNPFDKDE